MNITLTDPQAQKLGEEIISLLNLKVIPHGDEKGRVQTSFGTKTPKGLARSVVSLIEKDKELIAELKEILNKTEKQY